MNACTSLYRCADGRWFILTLLNEERQYLPLLNLIGRPELAGDARFATQAARRANAPALIAAFDAAFAAQPLAHWRAALDAAGITFGLIGTLDDIAEDAQMRVAEALVPFAGEDALTVSSPFLIDGEIKTQPRRAPQLGQHNEDILREAGYSDAEIARLRQLGVLA